MRCMRLEARSFVDINVLILLTRLLHAQDTLEQVCGPTRVATCKRARHRQSAAHPERPRQQLPRAGLQLPALSPAPGTGGMTATQNAQGCSRGGSRCLQD